MTIIAIVMLAKRTNMAVETMYTIL